MKKIKDLTGLVATKGQATPSIGIAARTLQNSSSVDTVNNIPLNFRVSADLRRRFRMFAAANDLKLNELLKLAFDAYEKNR
jgi:hypothetical protein